MLTSLAPWAWLVFGALATATLIVFVWRQTARLGQVQVVANDTDPRFRHVFDEAPVGMSLATADEDRFVRVNPAFCRMLGYAPEEIIGHVCDEFAAPDSIGMPSFAEGDMDTGRGAVDKHYLSKTGKVISARVRVVRLAPTATGPALVLGLAEDVTEQRKLETALRQTQKMEAIGQVTGRVAHDFNNILGIIIGNLDLVEEQLSTHEEAAELVGEARNAAVRGADLTSRLLAFARPRPLHPKRIDLNEMIGEIAGLLSRTLGDQVRIELCLAADVWPILADAKQLESCIISLANNACDAMPNGGTLTLATTNQSLDVAGRADVQAADYALIEISDTGTGMPADVLARIFDPFFTTKEIGKEPGLGLSMVFGFLQQSNGYIIADSEPDRGSTFRVYLPRMTEVATDFQSAPGA